jgi:acyl-CoA thioester hydrolase
MLQYEIQHRIAYYETDAMGYVHHSNYIRFFERARTELMRHFGCSYAEIEKSGVMMPVIDVYCRYRQPGLYDNLITIRAIIKELPVTRLHLDYEIFNEAGNLLCTGYTTLIFVDAVTRRPRRIPEVFLEALKKNFSKEIPLFSHKTV